MKYATTMDLEEGLLQKNKARERADRTNTLLIIIMGVFVVVNFTILNTKRNTTCVVYTNINDNTTYHMNTVITQDYTSDVIELIKCTDVSHEEIVARFQNKCTYYIID